MSHAASYPAEWESDVALTDGGTVHLRPTRPDDDERLLELYRHLSEESMYLRFFSPVPAPTARQLERLASVDYRDHMALAALLGDDMVAVARYDRTGPDRAEVAFTVRDDQQGRGLATLMLEHLAAIAHAHGIERFVASTLPGNHKMLNVFRDAGFEMTRQFADGAVQVEFSIEPTASSRAAAEERERVSEGRSVARLLAPRSIAVVGAGRSRGTLGHEVFRNLLAYGFTGPVYPVNTEADTVAGVRAYPDLLAVPDDVDVAIVAVPATAVPSVIDQAARRGVHGIIVISAGFAELGETGRAAEHELVHVARRDGMRLIGPNCMGVVNTDPAVRMNASFAPVAPDPGPVAFLSQSGTLGTELLARAQRLGLGISSFVSVGNKADVSGNDLLQHWEEDPATEVILLYLESFGNPRKFGRLARRIARHKPIVAVKSGRTPATRSADPTTGALPVADLAVDAAFAQAGVIRVDTLEELFDTARVLAHQPLPRGRRIAVVGNARGPATLAADACAGAGLHVAVLEPPTRAALHSLVPGGVVAGRPVDLGAGATPDAYEEAVRLVLADPAVDALLVQHGSPTGIAADETAAAIARAAATIADKPVVACLLGLEGVPDALRGGAPDTPRIPSFAFPEAAVRALARAATRAEWLDRPPGRIPELADLDLEGARGLVAAALTDADGEAVGEHGVVLDPEQAVELCRRVGIDVAPTRVVRSARAAVEAAREVGFPVALKLVSPLLAHRSDVGAVALDLPDARAARDAYDDMVARFEADGVIVQPMVPPGVETVVGVGSDPSFGPLAVFGMGGKEAELLHDGVTALVPLTDRDAHDLVRAPRSAPLLFGYRNAPPVAVDRLEELLLRVGLLADSIPEIAELAADPVVVSTERAVAVDVRVRVAPLALAPTAGVRRL